MKIKSIASLLIAFVLLSNSAIASAQLGGPDKFGAKVLQFDKEKFAATLKDRLTTGEPLTGYAAVIIKNGRIVAEAEGGWAVRENWNGFTKAKMTTSTPNDIGSCMKLISFITLLSLIEKKALKDGATSINKPAYLHSSIHQYLPKRWRHFVEFPPKEKTVEQQYAVKRVGSVTFAQLLKHKSGFRTHPDRYQWAYIERGIQQKDVGVRDYENVNATILTYLWPRLVDPAAADKIEKYIEDNHIANDDRLAYGKLYGDFFEKWMQNNVFGKITPRTHPSCNPGTDYPKRNPPVTFALRYENPLGSENPIYGKSKEDSGGCHAQGGYYLTMRELAAFMADFQASNLLVSEKVRKLMYEDGNEVTRDDRLGWSNTLQSPFATKHFGVNAIPYHGGDKYGHTAIVQLPGGYIAVGTVTGGNKASDAVATALKDAWGDALRANFEE
jgi:hypothetical protein